MKGTVVRLNRDCPLVRCEHGELVACEHATALVKGERVRAVIGDAVEVTIPEGHDKGIIEEIGERRTRFVRKDPAQRSIPQVLAANFDLVVIAEPIDQLNLNRLDRALVLAHETRAAVAVVLTKADLVGDAEALAVQTAVRERAGEDVQVLVVSQGDEPSFEAVRTLVAPNTIAILVGKSGVGKSSLVNLLVGTEVQSTSAIRERDGKGRHTTVDRVMIDIPGGGCIVDMPGVRGLGLWDADEGLGVAFADVERFAGACKFRDCKHVDEPGCAVLAAIAAGELAQARLDSYRALSDEVESVRAKREEARHLRGEKASDRKKRRARKRGGR